MAKKNNLDELFKNNKAKKEPPTDIRMGQDFHLSIDEEREKDGTHVPMDTSTHVHKNTRKIKKKAPPSRGHRIYDDNVIALKRIALDEKRDSYEVLDEAIREYRARKGY